MSKLCGFDIVAVDSIEEAVRGVDICAVITTADEPLIKPEWVEPGLFIAKAGSFQELDPAVVTSVDKVVVDSWKYTVGYRRVKELMELADGELLQKKRSMENFLTFSLAKRPGEQRMRRKCSSFQ